MRLPSISAYSDRAWGILKNHHLNITDLSIISIHITIMLTGRGSLSSDVGNTEI